MLRRVSSECAAGQARQAPPAAPVAPAPFAPKPPGAREQIGDLETSAVCVTLLEPNSRIMAMFEANPQLGAVTAVERDAPVGLINRQDFFAKFARPYARELFLRRECALFVDRDVLTVEASAPISEAAAKAAALGEKALADGCIVVENGRFLGHCSGVTLVRALSELQSEQHRRLISSIEYALTIQTALLAESRLALASAFPGRHAVVWRPRDIVGGDCFFAADGADGHLVGLMDCTGHGVPGALLTSIAISEVGRLASDPELRKRPAALLAQLSRRLKEALGQAGGAASEGDDGMDAAFIWAGADEPALRVASARLPVFLLGEEDVAMTLKGDRKGVGYRDTPDDYVWTEHRIPRARLRRILLASDGLADQIGGPRGLPLGWAQVSRALLADGHRPLQEQIDALWRDFETHQGGQARRDDVTLLGLDFGDPGSASVRGGHGDD